MSFIWLDPCGGLLKSLNQAISRFRHDNKKSLQLVPHAPRQKQAKVLSLGSPKLAKTVLLFREEDLGLRVEFLTGYAAIQAQEI